MSSVDAANNAANDGVNDGANDGVNDGANDDKEKERRKQKEAKGRMYGILAGIMFALFVIAVLAFIAFIGYIIYRNVQGFKGTTTSKGGSADIKISDGAIIGTAVGVVSLIVLAIGGTIWYRRSKSKHADQQSTADQSTTSSPA